MKTIKIGERVKIAKTGIFKGVEATVVTIGKFDGKKRYQIETDGNLRGWYANNELEVLS